MRTEHNHVRSQTGGGDTCEITHDTGLIGSRMSVDRPAVAEGPGRKRQRGPVLELARKALLVRWRRQGPGRLLRRSGEGAVLSVTVRPETSGLHTLNRQQTGSNRCHSLNSYLGQGVTDGTKLGKYSRACVETSGGSLQQSPTVFRRYVCTAFVCSTKSSVCTNSGYQQYLLRRPLASCRASCSWPSA
jgi:hypothetical protein